LRKRVLKSKSMDEKLKALKSLQQLICLAAAAVLAFAVTTDRSKDYRAALSELEIYRKVDLNNYPEYVKSQFASEEGKDRAALSKAARQAHLIIRDSTVFDYPVIMNGPPQGAFIRLRDFDDFITSEQSVGVCLVNDEREVSARLTEQLKQRTQPMVGPMQPMQPIPETSVPRKDVPYTVTEVSVLLGGIGRSLNGVSIADPVVLHNSPNVESLQFLLFNGLPMPPSINISVGCTYTPSYKLHPALDWLKADENGKRLVDPKSGVIFPKLKPFWDRIADMGTENATLFLQERIEATMHGSLNLFGVSVDRDLVLLAGPAALFALLLFFFLHLKHVNDAPPLNYAEARSSKEYPWIACFRGRFSGAVTYGCLIGLPIGASLLLLIKHGELKETTTNWGAGFTLLLIVIGGFTSHEIYWFRRRVSSSTQNL